MIGCYLYNFGQEKPADAKAVRYQLNKNLEYINSGLTQGIILHTNAVGGMGFEAYEEAKKWISEQE